MFDDDGDQGQFQAPRYHLMCSNLLQEREETRAPVWHYVD